MSASTPDYFNMSDAEMDALDVGLTDEIASEVLETPAEEAAPPPTPEPTKPEPTTEDANTAADEAAKPGETSEDESKRKLLPEQKLRQRAQAAEQERDQVRHELATMQQQQQRNAEQAEYNRLVSEEGDYAAAQYAQAVNQQRQAQAQAQAAQAQRETVYKAQEDAFRVALPEGEYDALAAKVVGKYGLQAAQMLASQQSNAAEWVVKEGRSIQTPEESEAAIEKRVEARLKEALSKQQDAPKGQKSIGHLSSTRSSGLTKDASDMTEAELAQEEDRLRALW